MITPEVSDLLARGLQIRGVSIRNVQIDEQPALDNSHIRLAREQLPIESTRRDLDVTEHGNAVRSPGSISDPLVRLRNDADTTHPPSRGLQRFWNAAVVLLGKHTPRYLGTNSAHRRRPRHH